MELVAASRYSLAQLADLFTRGYEGYVVPFRVDEPTLAFMVRTFDIDLDLSRVALRDAEPVGLCNLGLRGDRAWIGGVGVVAAARRGGVGEALMAEVHDVARERGVREVWLEVIVENAGAAALYEKLGYRDVREVEVWTLDAAEDTQDALARDLAGARSVRARRRGAREPWQRSDEAVDHLDDVDGIVVEGGAAVFRVSNGRVSLLQIEGDETACAQILTHLRALGPVAVLNLPAGHPAGAAFAALGGTAVVRQREMVLPL